MVNYVLGMSYVRILSFSKFDYNGLDLFILMMHIPILNQVHIVQTYISYHFVFEVGGLCITLSTNYATID